MTTVFTRIIDGDLPGRFVWRDDRSVAFLSINPITPGHTLVVPRVEVDHWLDLDVETWDHLSRVGRIIGQAIKRAFDPPRVGLIVAGFEVPHVHVHVLQTRSMDDLRFENAAANPDPSMMDDARSRIVAALQDLGHDEAAATD